MKTGTNGNQHVFGVQVYLNDLNPGLLLVELYADGVDGAAAVHQQMERVRQLAGASGGYVYRAAVSAAPAVHGLHRALATLFRRGGVPLENARILWQR